MCAENSDIKDEVTGGIFAQRASDSLTHTNTHTYPSIDYPPYFKSSHKSQKSQNLYPQFPLELNNLFCIKSCADICPVKSK